VIALHQAGIDYAVASAGTALTDNQIQLISRFAKKISILFDNDAAGIKASLRGIDKILEHGLYVKVILLPTGEDPDSYVRKVGREAFQSYIATHEQDFITFKAKLLLQDGEDDLLQKTTVIEEILQSIVRIPDEIHRSLLLQQTSKLLEISEVALLAEHNKLLAKYNQDQRRTYQRSKPSTPLQLTVKDGVVKQLDIADTIMVHERDNIRLLLNYGNTLLQDGKPLSMYLLQELQDVAFQTPIYQEILTLYQDYITQGQEVDIKRFIQHSNQEIQKAVIDLTAVPYEVSDNWREKYQIGITQETDNLHQTAYKNILRLKLRLIHQMIEENNQLLKNNTDPAEEDNLLHIYTQLKQTEVDIAKQLGIVLF
jgi:DNA primase